DVAVEGGVAGAVDDPHAAAADLVAQLVARRTGGAAGRSRAVLGFGRGVGRQILVHLLLQCQTARPPSTPVCNPCFRRRTPNTAAAPKEPCLFYKDGLGPSAEGPGSARACLFPSGKSITRHPRNKVFGAASC